MTVSFEIGIGNTENSARDDFYRKAAERESVPVEKINLIFGSYEIKSLTYRGTYSVKNGTPPKNGDVSGIVKAIESEGSPGARPSLVTRVTKLGNPFDK